MFRLVCRKCGPVPQAFARGYVLAEYIVTVQGDTLEEAYQGAEDMELEYSCLECGAPVDLEEYEEEVA